eukprot:gene3770-4700_t
MQARLEHCQTRTMRLQNDMDLSNLEASDKALALGQILSSVSNILERCEESFRIRHNKPQIERVIDLTDATPLSDKCNRAISKLDEIAMFMVDYRDINVEFGQDAAYGKEVSHGKRATTQGGAVNGNNAAGAPLGSSNNPGNTSGGNAYASGGGGASNVKDDAKATLASNSISVAPDTSRSRGGDGKSDS